MASRQRELLTHRVVPTVARSLEPAGFRWMKSRDAVVRSSDGTGQRLTLGFASSPHYRPNALFALHPLMSVEYKATQQLMALPDVELPSSAVAQPLRYGTSIPDDWYVVIPDDAEKAAADIAELAVTHALPLFDDLRDLEGLLAAYERSDQRIMWHDQVFVAVVAAYVVAGRKGEARSVVASRFRGPAIDLIPPQLRHGLDDTR